jgi:hypothetical protein
LTISLAADCNRWLVRKDAKIKASGAVTAKPEMFHFQAHTNQKLGTHDQAVAQVIEGPSTL